MQCVSGTTAATSNCEARNKKQFANASASVHAHTLPPSKHSRSHPCILATPLRRPIPRTIVCVVHVALCVFKARFRLASSKRGDFFERYLTYTEDGHVFSLTKAGRNAAQRGRTKNNLTQDDEAQQIPPALPCVRLACLHRVQDVAAEKDPDCKTAHKDGDRKRQRHAHREDTKTHTCE